MVCQRPWLDSVLASDFDCRVGPRMGYWTRGRSSRGVPAPLVAVEDWLLLRILMPFGTRTVRRAGKQKEMTWANNWSFYVVSASCVSPTFCATATVQLQRVNVRAATQRRMGSKPAMYCIYYGATSPDESSAGECSDSWCDSGTWLHLLLVKQAVKWQNSSSRTFHGSTIRAHCKIHLKYSIPGMWIITEHNQPTDQPKYRQSGVLNNMALMLIIMKHSTESGQQC